MRIIAEPLIFEWDNGNKDKNLIKHEVTIQEAEETFLNKPFYAKRDKIHSFKEERYQALGKTNKDRWLFLSFTLRIEKVRIISVRDMNKKERKIYEKIQTNT